MAETLSLCWKGWRRRIQTAQSPPNLATPPQNQQNTSTTAPEARQGNSSEGREEEEEEEEEEDMQYYLSSLPSPAHDAIDNSQVLFQWLQ